MPTEQVTAPESKPAEKKTKAQTEIEKKAEEVKKAPPKAELSPSQAIGTFTESLDKKQATVVKTLYDELLTEFATEASSKIAIGRTLLRLRDELGENYRKFVQDCVIDVLRKSEATLYNYIALAQAAVHKFAANKVFATALFRIWSAEGCFDSQNGELKPAVDDAIRAIGGIPETKDSSECETLARRFISKVDALVKAGRSAQPGGRKWDAEMQAAKHAATVKAFRSFITNDSVSSKKAIKLLSDVLVEAMVEMSAADIKAAFEMATKQIGERKANIKETSEDNKAA